MPGAPPLTACWKWSAPGSGAPPSRAWAGGGGWVVWFSEWWVGGWHLGVRVVECGWVLCAPAAAAAPHPAVPACLLANSHRCCARCARCACCAGVTEQELLHHQFFSMEYAFRVLDTRPLPQGKTGAGAGTRAVREGVAASGGVIPRIGCGGSGRQACGAGCQRAVPSGCPQGAQQRRVDLHLNGVDCTHMHVRLPPPSHPFSTLAVKITNPGGSQPSSPSCDAVPCALAVPLRLPALPCPALPCPALPHQLLQSRSSTWRG